MDWGILEKRRLKRLSFFCRLSSTNVPHTLNNILENWRYFFFLYPETLTKLAVSLIRPFATRITLNHQDGRCRFNGVH